MRVIRRVSLMLSLLMVSCGVVNEERVWTPNAIKIGGEIYPVRSWVICEDPNDPCQEVYQEPAFWRYHKDGRVSVVLDQEPIIYTRGDFSVDEDGDAHWEYDPVGPYMIKVRTIMSDHVVNAVYYPFTQTEAADIIQSLHEHE